MTRITLAVQEVVNVSTWFEATWLIGLAVAACAAAGVTIVVITKRRAARARDSVPQYRRQSSS